MDKALTIAIQTLEPQENGFAYFPVVVKGRGRLPVNYAYDVVASFEKATGGAFARVTLSARVLSSVGWTFTELGVFELWGANRFGYWLAPLTFRNGRPAISGRHATMRRRVAVEAGNHLARVMAALARVGEDIGPVDLIEH